MTDSNQAVASQRQRVGYYETIPIAEYVGKQYEPANGTEGAAFHEAWCCNCARDKEMNGTCHAEGREPTDEDWCPILGASFCGEATQWVFGDDGWPKCTEFVPMDQPFPEERDTRTIDMFASYGARGRRDSLNKEQS